MARDDPTASWQTRAVNHSTVGRTAEACSHHRHGQHRTQTVAGTLGQLGRRELVATAVRAIAVDDQKQEHRHQLGHPRRTQRWRCCGGGGQRRWRWRLQVARQCVAAGVDPSLGWHARPGPSRRQAKSVVRCCGALPLAFEVWRQVLQAGPNSMWQQDPPPEPRKTGRGLAQQPIGRPEPAEDLRCHPPDLIELGRPGHSTLSSTAAER